MCLKASTVGNLSLVGGALAQVGSSKGPSPLRKLFEADQEGARRLVLLIRATWQGNKG